MLYCSTVGRSQYMRIFCRFLFSQHWNKIHVLLINYGRLFERCMLCFQFPFCTWKLKGKSFLLRKTDPFVKKFLVKNIRRTIFINQWTIFFEMKADIAWEN